MADSEKLHLCVTFRVNGDIRAADTVADSRLADHIEYNRLFRAGCYCFVDGEYACGGMLIEPYRTMKINELQAKLQKLMAAGLAPADHDTAPYE